MEVTWTEQWTPCDLQKFKLVVCMVIVSDRYCWKNIFWNNFFALNFIVSKASKLHNVKLLQVLLSFCVNNYNILTCYLFTDTDHLLHISVARYHGTTAAPLYHFSTVPVPSPLRYFLVPQYHKYRGSSARYLSVIDTQERRLHCISTEIATFGLSSVVFTAKLYTFYLCILCCFVV